MERAAQTLTGVYNRPATTTRATESRTPEAPEPEAEAPLGHRRPNSSTESLDRATATTAPGSARWEQRPRHARARFIERLRFADYFFPAGAGADAGAGAEAGAGAFGGAGISTFPAASGATAASREYAAP